MHRVLLADDSPHAQRMGESILREEGFEVVSVTDGQTAVVRIGDFDPDVVLADIDMPFCTGYDLCEFIKNHPIHKRTRVVLTAGAQETVDPARLAGSGADGVLKKPFEASAMLDMLRPLVNEASAERGGPPLSGVSNPRDNDDRIPLGEGRISLELAAVKPWVPHLHAVPAQAAAAPPPAAAPEPIDPDRVRAAVTLALDDAMTDLIDKITEKVLVALRSGEPNTRLQ